MIFDNRFLKGSKDAIVAGVVLGAGARILSEVTRKVREATTVTVEITDDTEVFKWIKDWLAQHPYTKHSRNLLADSKNGDHRLTPAIGDHLLTYKGHYVWVSRFRESSTADDVAYLGQKYRKETFRITILSRDRQLLVDLIQDARAASEKNTAGKIIIFRQGYDSWREIDEIKPRSIDSVILPDPYALHNIASDLEYFIANEQWYSERSVPHRRGYLFEGMPGSGKTSSIIALSSHLGKNIYRLSLTNPSLTDSSLESLFADVGANAIVAIEDIDCAYDERVKDASVKNSVSFSGLLNILDGIGSKEGRILFMTTNHKEKLDPALIRPGRVDKIIHFGAATKDQARRLYQRFFPKHPLHKATEFCETLMDNESMASLQARLITMSERT